MRQCLRRLASSTSHARCCGPSIHLTPRSCRTPHSTPFSTAMQPHSNVSSSQPAAEELSDNESIAQLTSLPPSHWQPAPPENVRAAKARLRRHIRQRLTALSPSDLSTQSELIAQRFLTSPLTSSLLSSSPAFALYLSMPKAELQTSPLLHSLFSLRRRVFVPVVRSPSDMVLLEAHSMQDVASFPVNSWGIPEPPVSFEGRKRAELLDCVEEVGVCVLPGVAFGRAGERLGHGRGYYDRYLARWEDTRQKRGMQGTAVYVGLALDCQLVPHLPCSTHDQRVHAVISHPHHYAAEPHPQLQQVIAGE